MDASASSSRQIAWPSVITVISAAILIGAEVFGAAFAGGWAARTKAVSYTHLTLPTTPYV